MIREVAAVFRKELRQARRDPRFMAPSLIVPFVFLLVYSIMWSTIGGGESFACGLVVQDISPEADDMAGIIENMVSTTNFTWFSIERYNLTAADSLWRNGGIIGYILIPTGFGANISSGGTAKITLFIANLNDDVVKNYVHRIEAAVLLYNQGAVYPEFNQSDAPVALQETLSLASTPSNLTYMAAVSIMLSLIACTLTSQAMSTASEFETGAIHDTLGSPTSRVAILLGRTLAAIPRSFLSVLVLAPVVYVWIGVTPVGNILVLVGIMLLTVLALVPIGEIIGMKTRKKEQSLLAGILLTVLGFLAGGGLAPIGLTPINYRLVIELLPMTHSIGMWARVFFMDTMTGLMYGTAFLLGCWIVLSFVVVMLTQREVERV
jgi:ABC-type multidrug transport system permease subunit